MNEEEVVAIYQELLAGINKIKKSGHKLPEGKAIQLQQLEGIVADLEKIAEEKGFAAAMQASDTIEINAADDLFQLVEATSLNAAMKQLLKKIIGKKYTDDGLSRAKLWEALKLLDKYHTANVIEVNAVNISTRMKGQWKAIFGQEIAELDLVALAYQESATAALMKEIEQLSKNKWLVSVPRLDQQFSSNFKGRKMWLLAADNTDNAKTQLKIDLTEWLLPSTSFKTLALTNGKVQVSGKLGFTKPVVASAQAKVVGEWVSVFSQGFRNTIGGNLSKLFQDGLFKNGSTTAASVGITLHLPLGMSITAKIDGGKMKWSDAWEAAKKGNLGTLPTSWSVRISVQVDLKAFIKALGLEHGLEKTILDDSLCKLAISGGWDLSLDWTQFADIKLEAPKNNKKANTPSSEDIAKDRKIEAEVKSKQKKLLSQADDLAESIDQKDMKAMKQRAKQLKSTAEDIQDLMNNHTFSDKNIRKGLEAGLQETGETIGKKLSGPIAKMAKAFKYAKPLARLLPGINAIVTVIEIASFVIGFVNWFNSVNATTWEDYFIAAGKYLEDHYGGWHKWLDRKMKGY